MAPVSLEQFVGQLTGSGLMAPAEVDSFQKSLPGATRPKDAEALARELIRAGRLTQYQTAAAFQGKARSLVFGEYVVLDKLGQGGMGVVLKAQHRRMKRLVAIKVLPAATMKSPEVVRRFYREVEAAAKLSHPNIVASYDASEHAGMHYLVMEYVDGKDLAAIVKEFGPMPVRQAVECVLQSARGLQYAHELGIVHRDIKPGNLLLDKRGTVKILDMGLARITEQGPGAAGQGAGEERLTQSGQVMGTCDYMAPEQALDTHTVDGRADIYSLGCTLYRLLTGNVPYQADSFAKLFLAHMNAPIPSLCEARPDVPGALDVIYQKMMAKRAQDRQQSMAEVIADLEAFLGLRRTSGDEEESLANGALSFLREFTHGATSTQQKIHARVEDTLDRQLHPEAGTNVGQKLLLAVRRRKRLAVAVGAVALLAAVGLGIVITIRTRGGKTAVEVPSGSEVAISNDGRIDVTLPAASPAPQPGADSEELRQSEKRWGLKRQEPAPASTSGGFNPKLAASEEVAVLRPSPFLSPDSGWWIPAGAPRPAVAPLDATKARELQEAWAKYLGVPVEMTNSIGMKFMLIPPGEFEMGTDARLMDERLAMGGRMDPFSGSGPQHHVRITRPFYLGACEVTCRQYVALMGSLPSSSDGRATDDQPVIVDWPEADRFCSALSKVEAEATVGRRYRLPYEAEWEYACRAGSTLRYVFGDELAATQEYAWPWDAKRVVLHPVAQKKPNPWGLFDMLGNLLEYCSDFYDPRYYQISPTDDPRGTPRASSHVIRGGFYGGVWPKWPAAGPDCRAYGNGKGVTGFRLVYDVDLTAAGVRPAVRDAEGFESLFDGKTLQGWDGDPAVWRVEEGAITAETAGRLKEYAYLIWRGGEVDDFDLRFDYRLSSDRGNSGFQYRSVENPAEWGRWVVAGYQFDIDDEKQITGSLFEERGRVFCARLGQETILGPDHTSRVVRSIGDPVSLQGYVKKNDWNSCRIVAQGFVFLQEINGQLMAKATDEDPQKRRASGLLAIQVHKSWPIKIQFRNIRLKRLGPTPDAAARPAQSPAPAIVPFDAEKARQHQEAWAKHVGVPVEMTNSIGMKFMLIPPGECKIGSTPQERAWAISQRANRKGLDREGPEPRKAKIRQAFWLGQTEVTVGQWKQFAEATGYLTEAEKTGPAAVPADTENSMTPGGPLTWRNPKSDAPLSDGHVATWISWNDAVAFCRWLTEREHQAGRLPAGLRARLPTEAEWEYACRAGADTKFWWGNASEDGAGRLNLGSKGDGFGSVAPAGHFGPRGRNQFGLADMLGNVREWCLDGFDPDGAHAELWTDNASHHATRGGCCFRPIGNSRCANRDDCGPSHRAACTGFRVLCEIPAKGD